MKVLAKRKLVCGWAAVALLGLVPGCMGVDELSETPLSAEVNSSTSQLEAGSSAQPASGLSDAELALLRTALAGLSSGNGSGSAEDALGAAPSLSDLKSLRRRDLAVWVLDFATESAELAPEQEVALRLLRAVLTRDSAALQQLVMEQLLTTLTGAASTSGA